MTKLSDTQAVILSAASQRDDGAILPLPETLKIKGGAVDKVLGSLKAKGLIDHIGAPRGDNPPPLRITRAGLQAIGIETEDGASEGATTAKRRAKAKAAKPFVGRAALARVMWMLVPSIVYVVLIKLIGIYVASTLFIAFFMRRLGRYPWVTTVAVAAGVMVVFFLLFEVWFKLPLPKGPLESWLRLD